MVQVAAYLMLACTLVAKVSAGASDDDDDLEDCVCQRKWVHNEYKCNSTEAGGVQAATFNGCPALNELSKCEYNPEQSWCMTTQKKCKQQTKDSFGERWVYCDPENDGAPQKPFCTCKSSWKHFEGKCAGSKSGATMHGCPSIDQIRECEPDYPYTAQSWCETEEEDCFEQEDWVDADDFLNETMMVGNGWAYCSPVTGEAELPDCTCGSPSGETQWKPDEGDCNDPDVVFDGCPAYNLFKSKCGMEAGAVEGEQPWCNTMQSRCKQQSSSAEYANMIGDGWAYCDTKEGTGIMPECECRPNWTHKEGKCSDPELNLEMEGCPSIGQIGLCEFHATESWCDTTYDKCDKQSDDESGEGWAYCSAKSGEAILPPCECKDRWMHDEGDGTDDICDLGNPKQFRGCPTVDQIRECELNAKESWCYTTSTSCRDQDAESEADGWVYCDPYTQLAVNHHSHVGVGGAIGATFVLTVLFCSAVFVGFLLGYRRYINRHKRGYSQELLEPETAE